MNVYCLYPCEGILKKSELWQHSDPGWPKEGDNLKFEPCICIFAFGEYSSKQVNVRHSTLPCANVGPGIAHGKLEWSYHLPFLESYTPNANIYTRLLGEFVLFNLCLSMNI